ncbi:hypothetical protein [Nocardioides sp. SYSU DS0663]|uniref:hypothetical protein n=1 Tax=Nocardioides sp. SYSU DS0663 TaxID=3416445 RepID=UPI003F4B1D64
MLQTPGLDAELAWDDVGTIDYVATESRWAAVSVVAARDVTLPHELAAAGHGRRRSRRSAVMLSRGLPSDSGL